MKWIIYKLFNKVWNLIFKKDVKLWKSFILHQIIYMYQSNLIDKDFIKLIKNILE